MIFNVEVKISLKEGMLNPEASTIERALDLLGYEVKNTSTVETIKFQIEENEVSKVNSKVEDMCRRLLCNPIIHDYEINILKNS